MSKALAREKKVLNTSLFLWILHDFPGEANGFSLYLLEDLPQLTK